VRVKQVDVMTLRKARDEDLLIAPDVYFFHAVSGNSDFVIEFRRCLFAQLRRHRKLKGGMVKAITAELFDSIGVQLQFNQENQSFEIMVGDNAIASYCSGTIDRMFMETIREEGK